MKARVARKAAKKSPAKAPAKTGPDTTNARFSWCRRRRSPRGPPQPAAAARASRPALVVVRRPRGLPGGEGSCLTWPRARPAPEATSSRATSRARPAVRGSPGSAARSPLARRGSASSGRPSGSPWRRPPPWRGWRSTVSTVTRRRVAELAAGRPVAGVRVADFELAPRPAGSDSAPTRPSRPGPTSSSSACRRPWSTAAPDLSAVEGAGADVAPHLRPGCLVVLESTTYPGTTEGVLRPRLEAHGLRARHRFPARLLARAHQPGRRQVRRRRHPRIVVRPDPRVHRVAAAFYGEIVDQVHTVSSCRAAELAKLLENTFRMVNIALVNELAVLVRAGLDLGGHRRRATKPFGFMPFFPGPGVGGHCIPSTPPTCRGRPGAHRAAPAPGRDHRTTSTHRCPRTSSVGSPRRSARRGKALNGATGARRRRAHVQAQRGRHPRVRGRRGPGAAAPQGARVSFHDPFSIASSAARSS